MLCYFHRRAIIGGLQAHPGSNTLHNETPLELRDSFVGPACRWSLRRWQCHFLLFNHSPGAFFFSVFVTLFFCSKAHLQFRSICFRSEKEIAVGVARFTRLSVCSSLTLVHKQLPTYCS